MTNTITKAAPLPIDLPSGLYSAAEIQLLGHCWADAGQISANKTKLALHLYELKKELEAKGPAESGANGRPPSRFWTAFEAGHLPLQGKSGRRSVETALTAAEWLTEGVFRKYLHETLHTLAPSTIAEISTMGEPAQAIAFKAIESGGFIGTNAVRLLAHIKEQDVFSRLDQWIKDDKNKAKVLTPTSINDCKAEVEQAQRKANTPEHLKPQATASSPEVINYQPPTITPEDRHKRNQELLKEQNVRDTREAIEAPDREAAAELQKFHKLYSDALAAALKSLGELRCAVNTIATVKGTIYLDELRECQGPLGFNYLANDIKELQRAKDLLLEIVKVAVSHEGPQSIDWETINTEAL